jgi:hypothetical protein
VKTNRGAILGERLAGFNQENALSDEKILSPSSVDIPVDGVSIECQQSREFMPLTMLPIF